MNRKVDSSLLPLGSPAVYGYPNRLRNLTIEIKRHCQFRYENSDTNSTDDSRFIRDFLLRRFRERLWHRCFESDKIYARIIIESIGIVPRLWNPIIRVCWKNKSPPCLAVTEKNSLQKRRCYTVDFTFCQNIIFHC